jgi:hypothetical protein
MSLHIGFVPLALTFQLSLCSRNTNRKPVWLRHTALNDFGFDLVEPEVESYGFPVDNVFVEPRLDKPGVWVFIRLRYRIFLSVFFDFRVKFFFIYLV